MPDKKIELKKNNCNDKNEGESKEYKDKMHMCASAKKNKNSKQKNKNDLRNEKTEKTQNKNTVCKKEAEKKKKEESAFEQKKKIEKQQKTENVVLNEEAIANIFSKIQTNLKSEMFDKALKFCNQILDQRHLEEDAAKCKIYCLLQLGKFQAALSFIEKAEGMQEKQLTNLKEKNNATKAHYAFEKCYCLYKLGKYDRKSKNKAENVTNFSAEYKDNICFLHLQAQLFYRTGEYDEAKKIYEDILKKQPKNKLVLTNLLACVSSSYSTYVPEEINDLAKSFEKKADEIDFTGHYELIFNLCCFFIDRRQFSLAYNALLLAEELCKNEIRFSFSNEKEDENIEQEEEEENNFAVELWPIKIQKAFFNQKNANFEKASKIYNLLLHKVSRRDCEVDDSVLCVAKNNLLTILNQDENFVQMYEDLKKLGISLRDLNERKLTKKQLSVVLANRCIALLKAEKFNECHRAILSNRFKVHESERKKLSLVHAVLLMKENKLSRCQDLLKKCSESKKDNTMIEEEEESRKIALALLKVKEKNYLEASNILQELVTQKYYGNEDFITCLVYVQKLIPNIDGAVHTLQNAYTHFCKQIKSEKDENRLMRILLHSGKLCEQLRRWKDACEYYKNILENIDGANLDGLVGIVKCASHFDINLSKHYSSRLMKYLPSRVHTLDAEEMIELELSSIYRAKKRLDDSDKKEEGIDLTEKKKMKKKKKRKIRYPKNYNPAKASLTAPDPERWLPKYERSSYKKMYKRRQQIARGGAQGSTNSAEVSSVNNNKPLPSTAQSEPAFDSHKKGTNRRKRR